MKFLKDFFSHDNTIIGLCGLKKRNEYTVIQIPQNYKKSYIPNIQNNYLLL